MIHFFHTRTERLCALAIIGEISPAEATRLDQRLDRCPECRTFYEDLRKIASVDLNLTTPNRMSSNPNIELHPSHENALLGRIMERTTAGAVPFPADGSTLPRQRRRMIHNVYASTGWAAAGLLLFALFLTFHKAPLRMNEPHKAVAVATSSLSSTSEIVRLKSRAQELEAENARIQRELIDNRELVESTQQSLQDANQKNSSLAKNQKLLEDQLTAGSDRDRQLNAALAASESSLSRERESAESLQQQLAELNSTFERQKVEVAHLRNVAETTPVNFPVLSSDIDAKDALEIVRARDLHIVDVYDVDHSGNSEKSYGRVYYVNRHLLLFYAFDLANTSRKSRKAVAFQAWGVGQHGPGSPRSLGLFYLDDSQLDRWVLRISDPQVLSHVETLFVTVEPPGGSAVPRGRQLLFASLAGPANHP
jgi:hypothetical protein